MQEKLSPEIIRALIKNENCTNAGLSISVQSISSSVYMTVKTFFVSFYLFGSQAGTSIAFRSEASLDDFFLSLNAQYSKTTALIAEIRECG